MSYLYGSEWKTQDLPLQALGKIECVEDLHSERESLTELGDFHWKEGKFPGLIDVPTLEHTEIGGSKLDGSAATTRVIQRLARDGDGQTDQREPKCLSYGFAYGFHGFPSFARK